jgi:hypothetical protein
VSITDRDKKIILFIIPLLVLGAYWFFALAPKRDEANKAAEELTQAQGRRDNASAQLKQLNTAKASFARDFATVIRLGKSVPATVDMPSLLVQLDRAARGTGIEFQNVKTGQRTAAPGSAPASGQGAQPPSSKPAQPGAPPAQSGPGRAAQAAGGAVQASNDSSAKAGASAGNQQAPAAPGAAGVGGSSGAPGLESVPLEFTFKGNFFSLSDFFHRMKRFVRVANDRIIVRGRLITIDSFSFKAGSTFPKLKAEVKATVYLAPKAEGVSAGATPSGPASGAPPAATPQTASNPTPPAATVTP